MASALCGTYIAEVCSRIVLEYYAVITMRTCPECHSDRIHGSRARNTWEAWRKRLTRSLPFRCHLCGWRGWMDAALDFADHAASGSSSRRGSHLLNKVSPDDLDRPDMVPALPRKRDDMRKSS